MLPPTGWDRSRRALNSSPMYQTGITYYGDPKQVKKNVSGVGQIKAR